MDIKILLVDSMPAQSCAGLASCLAQGVAEYQTLLAGALALLGASVGAWALYRQTIVQREIAQASTMSWRAAEERRIDAQRAALVSLLIEDFRQLREDVDDFEMCINNAEEDGVSGIELRKELASYDDNVRLFQLTLNWTDLSLLDIEDIQTVRRVTTSHARLVGEIDHATTVLGSDLPLFQTQAFQFEAEKSAIEAVKERLRGLSGLLDIGVRDLAERYNLELLADNERVEPPQKGP